MPASTSITVRPFSMSWRAIVILTDVNVLIYAHREDAADHRRFREWLEKMIAGPEAFRDYSRFPGLRWRHPF